MPFLRTARRPQDERLLWSRDIRFVHRLAARFPDAHVLELETGTVLIAPADLLTENAAHDVATAAGGQHIPEFGLVSVDSTLPERDRYLIAMGSAVRLSGLAERIGMAQSTQVIQTKMLDYFFSLRKRHMVAFQPIVELADGTLHEHECLFRPDMPMLPQSIASVVQAGIDTGRAVELDRFLWSTILDRISTIEAEAVRAAERPPFRYAINLMPATLVEPTFAADLLAAQVREAGLEPRNITIECTEQQTVADIEKLRRHVRALRRAGFGVAIDDAGAGYASFALIAALRPTYIKIDRDIVHGIGHDNAKQALVEAFVSFGRRIGARLIAEGIERRADLALLTELGVDMGQGYLLGKPASEPLLPRRMDRLRLPDKAVKAAKNGGATAAKAAMNAPTAAVPPARVPSRA